jgi:hypothetical protein
MPNPALLISARSAFRIPHFAHYVFRLHRLQFFARRTGKAKSPLSQAETREHRGHGDRGREPVESIGSLRCNEDLNCPHRLVAQDVGFSVRKPGFDSPWVFFWPLRSVCGFPAFVSVHRLLGMRRRPSQQALRHPIEPPFRFESPSAIHRRVPFSRRYEHRPSEAFQLRWYPSGAHGSQAVFDQRKAQSAMIEAWLPVTRLNRCRLGTLGQPIDHCVDRILTCVGGIRIQVEAKT